MAHEQKLHLKIVATLGDSFSKIFSSTNKKMNDLAKTSRDLNAKMSNLSGLRELQKKTLESGLAFQKHQRSLLEFKNGLGSSSEMSKQQVRELDRLTHSVKKSSASYDVQSSRLKMLRNELKGAGVDIKNLKNAESSLRNDLEKTNRKMNSQRKISDFHHASKVIHQSAKNARSEAFGSLVGTGATAAAAMYDPLQYTHEMNKVHILGKESDGEKYNPKVLDNITQDIAKSYGMGLVETAKTASSYLSQTAPE
jgi:hypothetical protein